MNPTPENWNDAYCLILRSEPGLRPTLWMTVRAVDPEFPRRRCPGQGWQRIPDLLTLARARRYARDESPTIRRA